MTYFTRKAACIFAKVRQLRLNSKKNPLFLVKGRFSKARPIEGDKKNRKKQSPFLSFFFSWDQHLLSVMLIRNGQLLAALGTARSEHATTILAGHSLTETMLVDPPAVVGLECSFHCRNYCLFVVVLVVRRLRFHLLGCKSTHFFSNNQELSEF